jgi:LPXTG-motif cell wall-anchored protein
MQHHSPARSIPTGTPRTLTAAFVAIVGALLMTVGVSAGSVAGVSPTQTVPLHNESANAEFDCPDDDGDYWHFVLAPNDGTFTFVSITLMLDDIEFTFEGDDIIPNGGQLDNVFVAVPYEWDLFDLVTSGSYAEVSPEVGTVKFVLSHICDGYGTNTTTTNPYDSTTTTTGGQGSGTTTTLADTTTTVADTTTTVADTTTTLADDTTTTLADTTTTTVADTTTTTALADTTTTTEGGDSAATTTTVGGQTAATTTTVAGQTAATTTIVAQSAATSTTVVAQNAATTTIPLATRLPRTGSDGTQPLTLIGGVLTLLGVVMLLSTRRISSLD